jgi:hypothetical protein
VHDTDDVDALIGGPQVAVTSVVVMCIAMGVARLAKSGGGKKAPGVILMKMMHVLGGPELQTSPPGENKLIISS